MACEADLIGILQREEVARGDSVLYMTALHIGGCSPDAIGGVQYYLQAMKRMGKPQPPPPPSPPSTPPLTITND